MGTVIAVAGLTLMSGARGRRVTPELALLANGVGLGLGVVDVLYVRRRRIKPIYLADAVIEAGFAAAWLFASSLHSTEQGQRKSAQE